MTTWQDGLVGCWNLAGQFGPCHDQINNLDLAKHGRPGTAVVKDRGALCCNPVTKDAALHPNNDAFKLSNLPMTWALWVLFDEAPDGFPFLLAKHSSANFLREWALIAAGGTSQRFAFQVFDGSTVIGEAITPGDTLVPGKWHLLVASYDPESESVSLTLDNQTTVTGTVTGTPGTTLAPLSLGCDGSLTYFTGASFADLLLWRRLLTPVELVELWNNGLPL